MKRKRTVVHVVWDKDAVLWTANVSGASIMTTTIDKPRKDELVKDAAALLWNNFFEAGFLGQIVVHGKNGKVQFERTYGSDPRRTKG